jgi:thioredoxin 1
MSDVKHVDDSNFQSEVLDATGPVLVDFGATWCGPCQRQLPILETFATINNTLVKVCTVDVDDAPRIAAKLGIRGVPTLLMFENGKQTGMKVGLSTMMDLNSMLVRPAEVTAK